LFFGRDDRVARGAGLPTDFDFESCKSGREKKCLQCGFPRQVRSARDNRWNARKPNRKADSLMRTLQHTLTSADVIPVERPLRVRGVGRGKEGAGIMVLRLGDLLVRNGVLTEAQRDEVLQQQRDVGRPFGELAEMMFGVNARDVEQAWAEQYAALSAPIDPRRYRPSADVLGRVSKRQAWQFEVLPLKIAHDELILCTTQENLPRAMKFAGWRLGEAVSFVLANPKALGEALERHYPMGGMSAAMIGARATAI